MSAPLAGRLPDRAFAGVLFDMDGTLIDSVGAVERSWLRWCEEFGIAPAALAASEKRRIASRFIVDSRTLGRRRASAAPAWRTRCTWTWSG